MDKKLIAPCGMYCGICDKYLAFSHQLPKKRGKICYCKGCHPQNKNCSFIKKKCVNGKIYEIDFCFECEIFPCENLKRIAKRGKETHNYDLVENLYLIQEKGISRFVENQEKIFKCNKCGDTICIYNQKCYSCDADELTKTTI